MPEPTDLEVHVEHHDAAVVLRPVGEIDLSCAPALRHQISEVQRTNPACLVVDLSEVPYMDSSGLATLVEAMQVAIRRRSKLFICGLQDRVRSIFEIARLHQVFVIVPDVEAALVRCRESGA